MFKGFLSYWMLPLFSAVVWLAMLLALIISWAATGKPIYPSMRKGQTIPYISNIAAENLKPLFIAMGSVSVITFDLAFVAERWLRHLGRLAQNTSKAQKALAILSIVFALIGGGGLILLTIFDTKRFHTLHDVFLTVFIAGYVLSAIFICAEYQRLGVHFREFRILRMSFWIKLAFILIEVALAIVFGVSNVVGHYNIAGVVEWVIAVIYSFFVMSFAIDFLPALHADVDGHGRPTEEEMAVAGSDAVVQGNQANHYRGRDGPPTLPPLTSRPISGFLSPHDTLFSPNASRPKSIGDSSVATDMNKSDKVPTP